METAKLLLSHKSMSKSDSKPISALPLALNDQTSAFKNNGTAVIYETEETSVRIIGPAIPMREESTHGTARMRLYLVLDAIQTLQSLM